MSANNLMPYVTRVASGKLEKLRDKRKPLTKREIKKLSDILFELDIDMREELTEIEIDETLPRIEVPPKQLEEHLRNHDLDPNISTEPLQLFSDDILAEFECILRFYSAPKPDSVVIKSI